MTGTIFPEESFPQLRAILEKGFSSVSTNLTSKGRVMERALEEDGQTRDSESFIFLMVFISQLIFCMCHLISGHDLSM